MTAAMLADEAKARCADARVGDWLWHVHHDVLCEPLTEPAAVRIDYIVAKKPKREIATRLRLIAPVRGDIPAEYDRARAEYDRAWAEYARAWAEYARAWAEYARARAEYARALAEYDRAWAEVDRAWAEVEPALLALHATECGCGWTPERGIDFGGGA